MSRRLELTGRRFGRWRALRFSGINPRGRSCWRCICDCGVKRKVLTTSLIQRKSRSCGCLRSDVSLARMTTHGRSDTVEWRIWCAMKTRCTNPRVSNWKYYGGRGIRVCARWRRSFAAFFADMGHCPNGRSLDRKRVDGNYTLSNCRWATPKTQIRNRRPRRK